MELEVFADRRTDNKVKFQFWALLENSMKNYEILEIMLKMD